MIKFSPATLRRVRHPLAATRRGGVSEPPERDDAAPAAGAGEQAALAQQLDALLDELSAVQRQVLVLRMSGRSVEDVALVVGTTASAVRVIQHEALDRLRGAARARRAES